MDHHSARDALLAFALLLQEVAAVSALIGDVAGTGLAKPLLGAAVGLELRHGLGS